MQPSPGCTIFSKLMQPSSFCCHCYNVSAAEKAIEAARVAAKKATAQIAAQRAVLEKAAASRAAADAQVRNSPLRCAIRQATRAPKNCAAPTAHRRRRDPANVASFQRFLRFTTAMFVVPLATMTVAFMVLEPLVAKPADRMVYAGVAAIVAVQAVIVAFLVSAWNEDDVPMPAKPAPPPPKKRKFRWLLCFAPSEPGLGAISSTLKAE